MSATAQEAALKLITEQISEAMHAQKCHGCGCLHETVEALARTDVGRRELPDLLLKARAISVPIQYDCLGCAVCYPAVAANAFTDAFPDQSEGMNLCPTAEPHARSGWPPLPGDYDVVRYTAPVAVCTLNTQWLASRLRDLSPDGLAIAGVLRTENLGIERIAQNTLSNPNIRFLILCGEDTKREVGHLPGQSLKSLFENGVDDRGRIQGAMGRRPVLKNITADQVHAFCDQVELVSMIGMQDESAICRVISECSLRDPGPYQNGPAQCPVEVIEAVEPLKLSLDQAGYFVVYPDRRKHRLLVEHYTNAGLLTSVVTGSAPGALYRTIIERKLISKLDHAAYLGRELAKAERALETGEPYVQDRAPGELPHTSVVSTCGCSGFCGESK